jgi:hypothetical protein
MTKHQPLAAQAFLAYDAALRNSRAHGCGAREHQSTACGRNGLSARVWRPPDATHCS